MSTKAKKISLAAAPVLPVLPTIVESSYLAHWREGLSIEEYHGDKAAVSSSGVRRALKSAASFKAYWLGQSEPETKVQRFGTVAHMCMLEPWRFAQTYCVQPDFGDMRSSTNRAKRDEWRAGLAPGSTAVTQAEYDQLHGMIESLMKHDDARDCLTNGKSELSGWYRDAETGLLCRLRPDFLHFNGKALIDIKTTRSCEERHFARTILDYGYHIQLAMYAAGCEAITGVRVKLPTIIAIEKAPPYEVAVYVLDEGAMDLGTAMYRRGLRRIAAAVKDDKWPGYQSGVRQISVPAYAFQDDSNELNEEKGE